MTTIFKAPGRSPDLIQIEPNPTAIRKKLGGDYEAVPVLKGAMLLCRKDDRTLPFNVHLMGGTYGGPILLVGRGLDDAMVDLKPQLQIMLTMVLSQKESKR